MTLVAASLMFLLSSFINAGATDLIVKAKGSKSHGIYAHFKIFVNDLECGDKFTSSAYQEYGFSIPFSKSEIKEIKIVFDNDTYCIGGDRNLYVNSIIIGNEIPIKADNNLVKYFCQNGKELDYPGMLGWNGVLVFDLTKISFTPVL